MMNTNKMVINFKSLFYIYLQSLEGEKLELAGHMLQKLMPDYGLHHVQLNLEELVAVIQ